MFQTMEILKKYKQTNSGGRYGGDMDYISLKVLKVAALSFSTFLSVCLWCRGTVRIGDNPTFLPKENSLTYFN